jgi:hypothetical protein
MVYLSLILLELNAGQFQNQEVLKPSKDDQGLEAHTNIAQE